MSPDEAKHDELKTSLQGRAERRVCRDEILRELWEIKAMLNAEANYDVAVLAKRANETARRLGFLIG
jgi:hypothetical protein